MAFNKGLTDNTFEIYLNSEYDRRQEDTTADWTTEFNNIMLNPNKGYQVALSSVQIPNSCPQFHQNESHFKIGDGVDTYDVYYDTSKIFSSMPDMLNYVSSLFSNEISGVLVQQDVDSRKTKIINNSGGDLVLDFTHKGSINFFRKLGFVYSTNVTVANTLDIISSYYPSLIGTARFYIVCEEISNNSFSGKNYNNWSIFKSVNVNVGFGSYVNFQSNNELYYHDLTITTNLNNLSFRILDDKLRPVDLNGGGVLMSLFIREV
mgnify:CR=1 FL=1